MTDKPSGAPEGADTEEKIEVWDLPTRLFHWSLVFQVFVAELTGYIFPEWWMETHIWSGHAIVILIGFRIVWGFFGSEFSRFDTFIFSPQTIIEHVKGVIARNPRHYLGHNPAGGLMIFGLMIVLVLLTFSGMVILGGEENQGAFGGLANYDMGTFAKGLHGVLALVLLAMFIGHVGGVIMETKLTGESLVQAMITGFKKLPHGMARPFMRPPHVFGAAIGSGILIGGGVALLGWMASFPPNGHVKLEPNDTYESECGDCHMAYHPSMLPWASWDKILHTLDDHMGEDATLDAETIGVISVYLKEYAGENWDTEASNRFRNTVSATEPRRITETGYWIRKHKDVNEADYKKKKVGNKINCLGCHLDASTGHFDDQQIRIPRE